MLLKCYTQYVRKFGKFSISIGLEKVHSNPKKEQCNKNVQTTVQLCSFHVLVRLCLKSFRLGSSSTWTKNFQMYKLCLGKAEEPESQLATFTGSWRKQGNSTKASTSASLTKHLECMDHNKLWKILQEMGTPDHLNCLLRNLYTGQEATVRIGHGTTDWLQIGTGVRQGCILSPCLFNFYAENIMWIKIAGRNINSFRYVDDTTLMAKLRKN